MTMINRLKKQVDLPVWEWTRFAPAVSSAVSSTGAADNTMVHETFGRYIYYLISATSFWRYDTWNDAWMPLASPPVAVSTWTAMKFSGSGYEGRVISTPSSTSLQIPAFNGKVLKGFDIRIVSGTGKGQRRTITDVSEPTVHDSGVLTAITSSLLTDGLKTWALNQWTGYQVRVTFNTGISQVRKILYNNATSLAFADPGVAEYDYNANPMAYAPALSATAGSQAQYAIESSVLSLNSAWDVNPDSTSRFVVESGSITLFSALAAAPFYSVQVYDIATDTWYQRSGTSNLFPSIGTDGTIERTVRNASLWDLGTATGGSTTTLVDASKSWAVNELAGKYVRFVSGTRPVSGANMVRRIISNTATTITWASSVVTAPDATTKYRIEGFGAGVATSATGTTLIDTAAATVWTANRWANYLVEIISGTGIGQSRRIVSNTTDTLTVDHAWDTNPDATSGFIITGDYDKFYLMVGGQCTMIAHNNESDFATHGRQLDYGSIASGAVVVPGRRAQGISTITRAATVATVNTINAHGLRVGETVRIAGATGADGTLYNITTTVVSVPSTTSFTYNMAGTPTANATFTAHSTTTLVDASQNWTVNQFANQIVYYASTNAPTLTVVAMEILSNTSNTLTFKSANTLPVNGFRYAIAERAAFGSLDTGIATGTQSTTTLQDTTKTWVVNIHAGRRLKILSGAGIAQEFVISSNTANTLTFAAGTAPTAGSSSYAILDAPVRGNAINLLWAPGTTDDSMKGKFMFCARGGNLSGFDRFNINTQRWEVISTSPQTELFTTGAQYAYDGEDRIYFMPTGAQQRVNYLDVVTNWQHGAGVTPYAVGTAIIGNRMEIFQTADGLKYLWVNRHSNLEFFRTLLFT